MFRLSSKGDFGLLLLVALASRPGKAISAGALAREKHLSVKYVGRILNTLKNAGLIESKEGATGGYRLARKASEINLQEALTVLEGRLAPVKCLEGVDCPAIPYCDTRSYMSQLYGDILAGFRKKTIADLVNAP